MPGKDTVFYSTVRKKCNLCMTFGRMQIGQTDNFVPFGDTFHQIETTILATTDQTNYTHVSLLYSRESDRLKVRLLQSAYKTCLVG